VGEQTQSESSVWPGGIAAITLFVEDLGTARHFYEDVFRLPVHYEDEDSTVFKFGDTLVNLLTAGQAASWSNRRRSRRPRRVSVFSSRSVLRTSMPCALSWRSGVSSYSTGRWIDLGESALPASAIPAVTSGKSPTRPPRQEGPPLGQRSGMSLERRLGVPLR
jgi:hypothetical protein